MKTLAITLLALTLLACEKEEPVQQNQQQNNTSSNNNTSNNNNGGSGNNGGGTTNVDRFIWIFLASDRAYNNLDSLSYDDGSGTITTLNSADAQALFQEQGGANEYRYTNIPINGPENYEVEVCLYFDPYNPPVSQYYHYTFDVMVVANTKDGAGTCCPEHTNNTKCYQLEM